VRDAAHTSDDGATKRAHPAGANGAIVGDGNVMSGGSNAKFAARTDATLRMDDEMSLDANGVESLLWRTNL